MIYEWPHLVPPPGSSTPFRLVSRNLSSASAFTGGVRTSGPIVRRFMVKLDLPLLLQKEWRSLSAFLARLGGRAGKMRMTDWTRRQPFYNQEVAKTLETFDDDTMFDDSTGFLSGPLPPYVAADEAAVRGATSIVLRNLPVSLHRCLRAGDLIELRPGGIPAPHGFIQEIAFDASSDAAGKSRVYLEPPLRAGIAAGDMVVLTDPKTMFQLVSDDEGEINNNYALHGTAGLTFAEVLPE